MNKIAFLFALLLLQKSLAYDKNDFLSQIKSTDFRLPMKNEQGIQNLNLNKDDNVFENGLNIKKFEEKKKIGQKMTSETLNDAIDNIKSGKWQDENQTNLFKDHKHDLEFSENKNFNPFAKILKNPKRVVDRNLRTKARKPALPNFSQNFKRNFNVLPDDHFPIQVGHVQVNGDTTDTDQSHRRSFCSCNYIGSNKPYYHNISAVGYQNAFAMQLLRDLLKFSLSLENHEMSEGISDKFDKVHIKVVKSSSEVELQKDGNPRMVYTVSVDPTTILYDSIKNESLHDWFDNLTNPIDKAVQAFACDTSVTYDLPEFVADHPPGTSRTFMQLFEFLFRLDPNNNLGFSNIKFDKSCDDIFNPQTGTLKYNYLLLRYIVWNLSNANQNKKILSLFNSKSDVKRVTDTIALLKKTNFQIRKNDFINMKFKILEEARESLALLYTITTASCTFSFYSIHLVRPVISSQGVQSFRSHAIIAGIENDDMNNEIKFQVSENNKSDEVKFVYIKRDSKKDVIDSTNFQDKKKSFLMNKMGGKAFKPTRNESFIICSDALASVRIAIENYFKYFENPKVNLNGLCPREVGPYERPTLPPSQKGGKTGGGNKTSRFKFSRIKIPEPLSVQTIYFPFNCLTFSYYYNKVELYTQLYNFLERLQTLDDRWEFKSLKDQFLEGKCRLDCGANVFIIPFPNILSLFDNLLSIEFFGPTMKEDDKDENGLDLVSIEYCFMIKMSVYGVYKSSYECMAEPENGDGKTHSIYFDPVMRKLMEFFSFMINLKTYRFSLLHVKELLIKAITKKNGGEINIAELDAPFFLSLGNESLGQIEIKKITEQEFFFHVNMSYGTQFYAILIPVYINIPENKLFFQLDYIKNDETDHYSFEIIDLTDSESEDKKSAEKISPKKITDLNDESQIKLFDNLNKYMETQLTRYFDKNFGKGINQWIDGLNPSSENSEPSFGGVDFITPQMIKQLVIKEQESEKVNDDESLGIYSFDTLCLSFRKIVTTKVQASGDKSSEKYEKISFKGAAFLADYENLQTIKSEDLDLNFNKKDAEMIEGKNKSISLNFSIDLNEVNSNPWLYSGQKFEKISHVTLQNEGKEEIKKTESPDKTFKFEEDEKLSQAIRLLNNKLGNNFVEMLFLVDENQTFVLRIFEYQVSLITFINIFFRSRYFTWEILLTFSTLESVEQEFQLFINKAVSHFKKVTKAKNELDPEDNNGMFKLKIDELLNYIKSVISTKDRKVLCFEKQSKKTAKKLYTFYTYFLKSDESEEISSSNGKPCLSFAIKETINMDSKFKVVSLLQNELNKHRKAFMEYELKIFNYELATGSEKSNHSIEAESYSFYNLSDIYHQEYIEKFIKESVEKIFRKTSKASLTEN